jgi:hypothetical protein
MDRADHRRHARFVALRDDKYHHFEGPTYNVLAFAASIEVVILAFDAIIANRLPVSSF